MSTEFILGIVFFCLASLIAVVRKTYFELSLSELKKRKALGEDVSEEIITSLSYGSALRTLIWLLLTITLSASFTLFANALPIWLSIILVGLLIYLVFSYLPSTKISGLNRRLTKLFAPGLNWLLKHASRYLEVIYAPLERRYVKKLSPIFDSEDLLTLIKDLSKRNDHRIEAELLVTLQRSFTFDNRTVGDLMTPAKKVKKMLGSDVIGPILINDLHENTEGIALVREEPKGAIIGTLSISDLGIRSQGTVSTHMRRDLYYVNQDAPTLSVVKAFYDTKSNFFIVKDNNEKFVGVIGLDKVLKELTGPLSSSSIAKADHPDPEAIAKTDD